jgi:hypothetical protein
VFNRTVRRLLRDLAVVVCCGAVGFFAVAVPRIVDTDDGGGDSGRANPRIALSDVADNRDPAAPAASAASADVEPPDAPAPTPVEAVGRFLAAETRGDYATSYGLLGASDRAAVGSRAEWEIAHANLPTMTGATLGAVRGDGLRVEVESEVTFEPALDETRGLVPARADATWIAVAEYGGWRVAHSERRVAAKYPDANGAVSATETWVQARLACRAGPEYDGGLVGAAGPVAALCNARGPVEVGPVTNLEPGVGVEPFLAAFGPQALSWARVVPVARPVPLAVVLAPVADRWVVVGALESLPGGSS